MPKGQRCDGITLGTPRSDYPAGTKNLRNQIEKKVSVQGKKMIFLRLPEQVSCRCREL